MEDGFKLTPERLEVAITSRTRWLLLNSPSNPSGAVYSRDEYAALGEVLSRHPNVLVLSDEIYEHILAAAQPFVSLAAACPELRDRTLIVNGVSKAYAMTGWRLGYAAGPKSLIAALEQDAVAKHDLPIFDLAGRRRGRAERSASLRHASPRRATRRGARRSQPI